MPFTKGQSGNPVGRPRKGQALGDLIRRYGDQRDPPDKQESATKTVLQQAEPVAWEEAA